MFQLFPAIKNWMTLKKISPRKKIDLFFFLLFRRFYMRKTGNIQDMSAHFSQFWRVDWVLKANKRDTVYAHVIRRHWRWDVLKSRLSLWDSALYKVEISNNILIIHKVKHKRGDTHVNGWQTSRGHTRWHLVDKRGDISWTHLVTFRGHFCPREVLFLGDISWTFFGWLFVDIFWVNFCGHLSSNKLTQT